MLFACNFEAKTSLKKNYLLTMSKDRSNGLVSGTDNASRLLEYPADTLTGFEASSPDQRGRRWFSAALTVSSFAEFMATQILQLSFPWSLVGDTCLFQALLALVLVYMHLGTVPSTFGLRLVETAKPPPSLLLAVYVHISAIR